MKLNIKINVKRFNKDIILCSQTVGSCEEAYGKVWQKREKFEDIWYLLHGLENVQLRFF